MRLSQAGAAVLVLVGVAAGCGDGDDPPPPRSVALYVVDGQPDAVNLAVNDLHRYLETITGRPVRLLVVDPAFRLDDMRNIAEEGAVLVGNFNAARTVLGLGDSGFAALAPEGFVLRRAAVSGKTLVAVGAGDALGLQYAVYDLARRLGVRFLHPETELVPARGFCPFPNPLDVSARPSWPVRGFHLALGHPTELVEAFLVNDATSLAYATRYVDWLVKNGQNWVEWPLLDSVPPAAMLGRASSVVDYAHLRGLRAVPVVSFVSNEENAYRLVSGTMVGDVRLQIQAELDTLMVVPWDAVAATIGARSLEPGGDEAEVVDWMNTAAAHLGDRYGVPFFAVDEPGDAGTVDSSVRYYDLPGLADPGVGAMVRTVMFYGLDGPAPVYGESDFGAQAAFLDANGGVRALLYQPETSWWHALDMAVPLLLPVYLDARARDLARLAPAAADGTVLGVVPSTSGGEWGYWLGDYVAAATAWDVSRPWQDVVAEAYDALGGTAAATAAAVVTELAAEQAVKLRDGGGIAWLAGEEELDAVETLTGKTLRPARLSFAALQGRSAAELDAFEALTLAAIDGLAADYGAFEARLETDPPGDGAAAGAADLWSELHDGVTMLRLRAEHTGRLYRAALAAARGALAADAGTAAALRGQAEGWLAQGRAITTAAAALVAAREAHYRYPLALSTGGAAGVPAPNPTVYPYRALARTHDVFYWARRDEEAAAAVAGTPPRPSLIVSPAHARPTALVTADAAALAGAGGTLFHFAFGDGSPPRAGDASSAQHPYVLAGQYSVELRVDAPLGGSTTFAANVAVVLYELGIAGVTPALPSASPEAAALGAWLEAYVPELVIGITALNSGVLTLALSEDRDGDGVADPGTVAFLPSGFVSAVGGSFVVAGDAVTLDVGEATATAPGLALVLGDPVVSGTLDSVVAPARIDGGALSGAVDTGVLAALASAAGLAAPGEGLAFVASALGFDEADPPPSVMLELDFSAALLPGS